MVTLVAGGGTGKTRLAMAVGESELAYRRDGVWFVDLAALREPSQLESAIAHGMELTPTAGDVLAQILTFVEDKDLLLILDNCEHLIDACADFADAFLSSPGSSVVLATSRESLDVDGEYTIRIAPLSSTDPDAPAVRLFLRRAAAVDSTLAVVRPRRINPPRTCRRNRVPRSPPAAAMPVMTAVLPPGTSRSAVSSGRCR